MDTPAKYGGGGGREVWREAEDLRKVEEKKKKEIDEDRRWREELKKAEEEREQRESEWRRKEKGKGRWIEEDILEAGLSQRHVKFHSVLHL